MPASPMPLYMPVTLGNSDIKQWNDQLFVLAREESFAVIFLDSKQEVLMLKTFMK